MTHQTIPAITRPASATHYLTALAGFSALIAALLLLRYGTFFQQMGQTYTTIFILAAPVFAMSIVDIGIFRVYRRTSTGLNFDIDQPSWHRTLIKLCGLIGSFILIGGMYWVFSEYSGSFYQRYYALLQIIMLPWLLLAVPYFYLIDRRMTTPRDGYWHLGMLLTLRWRQVDKAILGQHILGWVIKGFFLPLMFIYMNNYLNDFKSFPFDQTSSFKQVFDLIFMMVFLIDVSFVSAGYLFNFRFTDTHLRSAEPTMLGWTVALVCYDPFWSLIGNTYLYHGGGSWGNWLWDYPVVYAIWGCVIMLLLIIYVWATICFGGRFSNLTHRGIITNGPYQFTKHPAYVAKNISWWLMFVPFIAPNGLAAIKFSIALLLLNYIYFLRAKTEERHLSKDPTYVQYALWMNEHGLFRFVNNIPWLRFITYKPPVLSDTHTNIRK